MQITATEGIMKKSSYTIKLKKKEKDKITAIISKGTEKARTITRGRILLLIARGQRQTEVAESLSVTTHTVRNICMKYLEGGLYNALYDKPRSGAPTKFDGRTKAKLTALACSEADEGSSRWSLRMLADKAVELGIVDNISHASVKNILKKTK